MRLGGLGFNQLKGMEITKYSALDSTKQVDGSNLGGQVLIPNPTVVEIQMVPPSPFFLPVRPI